ncbi:hypothetical protein HPHPA5_1561 [Helicobacter pylori Hp A-5]|nr:hypothetical protein HPHPA5_1561 [Helicobacter pylori Hp A-5]
MSFNHDFNTTKRNKKQKKQKNNEIFAKLQKKKTLYAIMLLIHSNANAFLMYEIPNIKI